MPLPPKTTPAYLAELRTKIEAEKSAVKEVKARAKRQRKLERSWALKAKKARRKAAKAERARTAAAQALINSDRTQRWFAERLTRDRD